MDSLDKEILNEIQWTFPLIPKPYSEMAKKFGLSDQEYDEKTFCPQGSRNNQTN